MLPTRISVWTAPGRSITTTRRVGGGGSTGLAAVASERRPLAERTLGARKRLLVRDVADDGEDGVVGAEPGLVEGDEVVARDARNRLWRARVRTAVGMEPVDQAIEHHPGEVVRVVVTDLQARQDLLPLPFDLLGRERRVAREVRHHVEAERDAVLHHHRVDEREIAAGAGADQTADRIDRGRDLLGIPRRRALVEERRDERRDTRLVGRVLRAAGTDDQPQADRRLLVVRHRDDLQAVGERPHLIRRKLHVAGRQRPWRRLRRPIRDLRACACRVGDNEHGSQGDDA